MARAPAARATAERPPLAAMQPARCRTHENTAHARTAPFADPVRRQPRPWRARGPEKPGPAPSDNRAGTPEHGRRQPGERPASPPRTNAHWRKRWAWALKTKPSPGPRGTACSKGNHRASTPPAMRPGPSSRPASGKSPPTNITLHDPAHLGLDEAASRELLAIVAPWFAEDGITLHYDQPTRWLASSPLFATLATASLERVQGRDVRPGRQTRARPAPCTACKANS